MIALTKRLVAKYRYREERGGKEEGRKKAGKLRGYYNIFPGRGMATHSSVLAWKILWTEEPGGLQALGLRRI